MAAGFGVKVVAEKKSYLVAGLAAAEAAAALAALAGDVQRSQVDPQPCRPLLCPVYRGLHCACLTAHAASATAGGGK